MKIRITILTENNKPRPVGLTEAKVIQTWQTVFNMFLLSSENGDTCVVETAEFVESEEE